MLIDWFTVGAQAFNFLLLLYLLKRFLYGPIVAGMDRRERRIAEEMEVAVRERARAEEEAAESLRRNLELEKHRDRRIKEVETEVEDRRRELLNRARAEADELRESWNAMVLREKREFVDELKRRGAAEVVRIARRAVSDLAGEEMLPRMVGVLQRKLEGLEGEERKMLQRAGGGGRAEVKSPAALEEGLRRMVEAALKKAGGNDFAVEFVTAPEMLPGIEITVGGLRLAWGVESYFDGLEKRLSGLLDQSLPSTGSPGAPSGGKGLRGGAVA